MKSSTDWFKAGARIARTGGDDWHARRVIHWVLSQGGYPVDAKEAAKGFLIERREIHKAGSAAARTGRRLGKT